MRLETTYKRVSYVFPNTYPVAHTNTKRRNRRAGRHQANLDLKRSVCEALDDVDFANMHFEEDIDDYEDYLYEPEYDAEAQAAKWERDNDDYMFRNRIGPYEGWREYDQEEWY